VSAEGYDVSEWPLWSSRRARPRLHRARARHQ